MSATKPSALPWPEPRSFAVDLDTGLMSGAGGSHYQKRLRELGGLYADASAFEALAQQRGDEVVYEVTDHRPSGNPGDLITGVTRMSPGQVGGEYFMTRGHIHAVVDRPELYYGLKGSGLMVMESADGASRIRVTAPGRFAVRWVLRKPQGNGVRDIDFGSGRNQYIEVTGNGAVAQRFQVRPPNAADIERLRIAMDG